TFTIPLVLAWVPAAVAVVAHPLHAAWWAFAHGEPVAMVGAGTWRTSQGETWLSAAGEVWTLATGGLDGWGFIGAGIGGVDGGGGARCGAGAGRRGRGGRRRSGGGGVWTRATGGLAGWGFIGAGIGGVVGVGLSMLLLRLGLLRRSFADYDAWEKRAIEEEKE